ncbi:MAG: hypothetical protein CMO66_06715 [Verrucomicrobiales bacterium]|nr:hypothetical protein [Verrucomicrobiales bacterium]|tara:strand:+ start:1137 stop:1637 length:501 start_codon:yes stop_codon:yes gene_type:complete
MAWGRKKQRSSGKRASEFDDRIATLQREIQKLQTVLDEGNPQGVREALKETKPARRKRKATLPEELNLTRPRPVEPRREHPGLYNAQGVRKFDLASAWERITGRIADEQPAPGTETRLYTFIPGETLDGQPALGIEKRKARNRFIFLFLIFLAVLWSVLTLLLPQL